MSAGDSLGHNYGRNSEFCVAVDRVTRTTGTLVNAGCCLRRGCTSTWVVVWPCGSGAVHTVTLRRDR